jgi:hypothetical protein
MRLPKPVVLDLRPGRFTQANRANAPIMQMETTPQTAVMVLTLHCAPEGSETRKGPG